MWRTFLLVLLLCVGLVVDAAACQRCGLFGRRCRYYAPAANVVDYHALNRGDVFVVQNNYPAPLVGQGNTLYTPAQGYQATVTPLLDPNLYFSQEQQLLAAADKASELRAQRTAALFQRALELQAPVAEKLAAGTAARLVLDGVGLNQNGTPMPNNQGLVINRDAYGKLQVQSLTQEQIMKLTQRVEVGTEGPTAEGPPPPPGKWPLLTQYCSQCHGLDVAEPKGSFYLGADPNVAAAMRDKFFKTTQLLQTGKMPPPGSPQPSDEEKRGIVNEISEIILTELKE